MGLSPGTYGRLVVSDDGAGMDESTLARACDPFFTTKPPGEGTGLGLAMAHGAIRQRKGLLTIGGIYGGLFSPVEAAAVGAGVVILIGFGMGSLNLSMLWSASRDSVVTTATVMLILIAAHMINPFLALSHIPTVVGDFIELPDDLNRVVCDFAGTKRAVFLRAARALRDSLKVLVGQ